MNELTFDSAFFSAEHIRDPLGPLAELRQRGSVHRSDILGGWAVLGWDDSRTVLKSRATGQGDRLAGYVRNLSPDARNEVEPISDYMDRAISFLDPPDHSPQRATAAQVLDAGLGKRVEPGLKRVVDERLDLLCQQDSFDAIEDFALPITVSMIASILGVHYEDREHFVGWVERIFSYIGSPMDDLDWALDCKDAYRSIGDYVSQLFAQARAANDAEPGTLIGLMVAPGANHGRTERDLVGMTVGMVQGGFETTATLISNTIAMLLQNPSQQSRVREDPLLVPAAVEEVLRLAPSLKMDSRQALRHVQLSDRLIREGEIVVPILLSANRDPAVFNEPDHFVLDRKPNSHLSFGFGTHFCLGAPLARMQAQLAIQGILDRLPNMILATEKLEWVPSALLRRHASLPVRNLTTV